VQPHGAGIAPQVQADGIVAHVQGIATPPAAQVQGILTVHTQAEQSLQLLSQAVSVKAAMLIASINDNISAIDLIVFIFLVFMTELLCVIFVGLSSIFVGLFCGATDKLDSWRVLSRGQVHVWSSTKQIDWL